MNPIKNFDHRKLVAMRLRQKFAKYYEEGVATTIFLEQFLDIRGSSLDEVCIMDQTYRQIGQELLDSFHSVDINQFGNIRILPAEDVKTYKPKQQGDEVLRRSHGKDKKIMKNLRRMKDGSLFVRKKRNVDKVDTTDVNAVASAVKTSAWLFKTYYIQHPAEWMLIQQRILTKIPKCQILEDRLPIYGAGKDGKRTKRLPIPARHNVARQGGNSHCLFKAFADYERSYNNIVKGGKDADLVATWQDVREQIASFIESNQDLSLNFKFGTQLISRPIKQQFTKEHMNMCFEKGVADDDVVAVYAQMNNCEISMKAGEHVFTHRPVNAGFQFGTSAIQLQPRICLNQRKEHWELNHALTEKNLGMYVTRTLGEEKKRRLIAQDEQMQEVERIRVPRSKIEFVSTGLPSQPEPAQLEQVVIEEEILEEFAPRDMEQFQPSAPQQEPYVESPEVRHVVVNQGASDGNGLRPSTWCDQPFPKPENILDIIRENDRASKPLYNDQQYPRVYHKVFKGDQFLPQWKLTLLCLTAMIVEWVYNYHTWDAMTTIVYLAKLTFIVSANRLAYAQVSSFWFQTIKNVTLVAWLLVELATISIGMNLDTAISLAYVMNFVNANLVYHQEIKIIIDKPHQFISKTNTLVTKDDAIQSSISNTTMIIAWKFWYGMPDWNGALPTLFGLFPGNYSKVSDNVPIELLDASLHPRQNAGFVDQEPSFDRIGRMFRTQDSYHTNFLGQYSLDFAARVSMAIHKMRRTSHEDFLNNLA